MIQAYSMHSTGVFHACTMHGTNIFHARTSHDSCMAIVFHAYYTQNGAPETGMFQHISCMFMHGRYFLACRVP